MNKFLCLIIVALSLGLSNCSSNKNSGGDPKAVLTSFFDALKKKDFTTAKKYATEDSKQLLDMVEMGFKSDKQGQADSQSQFDKAKMQFAEPKIDGDRAVIAVTETTSKESINFNLRKEKGDWKVAFDKTTMLSTAMEKMNEKGINVNDSIGKAMGELKGVNMDSLRQSVEREMKDMDTTR